MEEHFDEDIVVKSEPDLEEEGETTIYSCVTTTLESLPSTIKTTGEGNAGKPESEDSHKQLEKEVIENQHCNFEEENGQVESSKKGFFFELSGTQYSNKVGLNDHKKLHEEFSISCQICNRFFKNENLLHNHKCSEVLTFGIDKDTSGKSKNLKDKVFPCEVCNTVFTGRRNLSQHIKLMHTEVRPFLCGQCGKAFKQKQTLTLHEKTHSGIKEHMCDVCGKEFTTAKSLASHMFGHTGVRPFTCEQCGKTFSQRPSLNVHRRSHLETQPFKCNICEKTFYLSGSLTAHMRVHTGERPYKCEECGKQFSQKTHLATHAQIHSGVKPYKCSVCDVAFTLRRNLSDHELIHYNLKPFRCQDCGRDFRRKTHLNGHKCKIKNKKQHQDVETSTVVIIQS